MEKIRRFLALSFAQRNGTLLIHFLSSLIIARLLSPFEIGIFSVGSVIVSFSHIVRDFGVSNYVIQERELTEDRIRSAQTIVWITSLTIAMILIILSGSVGRFYSEPGVTLTMRVLAVNFVFLPIGAVTVALLNRQMEFGRLFALHTVAALIQNFMAITLAWNGMGFVSLAWAAVAGAAATAIGSLLCRQPKQPWLPGIGDWRRVFAAGTKLSGTSFFYEVGQGGPELICGKVLGLEAAGYFSRGFGAAAIVLRALNDTILPVAIPFFSGKSRQNEDMKTSYLQAFLYVGALSLPAFAFLAIMAKPLIVVLYGDNWLLAAIPLQVVCLGMAFGTLFSIPSAVLVGSGKLGTVLRLAAFFQSLKLILVGFGASSGLIGIAWGVALGDILHSIYGIIRANKLLGVSWVELLRSILPPIYVALGTILALWAGLAVFADEVAPLVLLSLACCIALLGWISTLFLVKHPLSAELKKIVSPDVV